MTTAQNLCKCISRPTLECMTPGEEYSFTVHDTSVSYVRTDGSGAGSWMHISSWQLALAKGQIVVTQSVYDKAV